MAQRLLFLIKSQSKSLTTWPRVVTGRRLKGNLWPVTNQRELSDGGEGFIYFNASGNGRSLEGWQVHHVHLFAALTWGRPRPPRCQGPHDSFLRWHILTESGSDIERKKTLTTKTRSPRFHLPREEIFNLSPPYIYIYNELQAPGQRRGQLSKNSS